MTADPPMIAAAPHDTAEPHSAPKSPAGAGEFVEIVIEPHKGWIGVDWKELVDYRELLYYLIWRDVKVKYKQAILGASWAVFVPLLGMIIYTVVGKAAGFMDKLPGTPPPYALYVYAGLLPWLFLQKSISDGGMALVTQQNLMSKIYMPRLYLPAAACGSAMIDMLISFAILSCIGLYYYVTVGWLPSWQIVFLPPLLLLTWMAALGLALTMSAATVLYRDLRFLIPFISQFGLWLSAVVYPPELLGNRAKWLALNPLAGIITGYRSAILGQPWKPLMLTSSVVMCSLLLVFGLFYFKRVERRFADIA